MKDMDTGGMGVEVIIRPALPFPNTVIIFFSCGFLVLLVLFACVSARDKLPSQQPQSLNLLFNPNPIEDLRKRRGNISHTQVARTINKGSLAVPTLGLGWAQRGAGLPCARGEGSH